LSSDREKVFKNYFSGAREMGEWTFLTLHAAVLSLISMNPRIRGTELSELLRVTERTIRKVIAELSETGYIIIQKEGRGNRYEINHDLKLRTDSHREIAVGHLLQVLDWPHNRTVETPGTP
jgi:DNA-binding transcriptional ArsR family regulator